MIPPAWELLERVFTVETLMTRPGELLLYRPGDDLAVVLDEARRQRFDLVPVVEGKRIVGVLCAESGEPKPLTDQWLVSRDTGIPDLLDCSASPDGLGCWCSTGRR